MIKQLKLFILTFICVIFSPSISAVESLKQLCTKQVAQVLVSADSLEQFRNNPHFIQEKGLNNEVQNLIKSAILSSYRPSEMHLRLNDWIINLSPPTLIGHSGPVLAGAWSPDGKKIATASTDKTVKIWDPQSNTCLLTIPDANNSFCSITWSPDGNKIAACSTCGTAKIWNVINGTPLHTLHFFNIPFMAMQASISWSLDGKNIIISYFSIEEIWDAQNGSFLQRRYITDNFFRAPDGKHFATADLRDSVKIYAAQDKTILHTLNGHNGLILSTKWSPDSKHIAIGSSDETAKIWDAENGVLLNTLTGHTDPVSSVAWSPDGNKIVTTSFDHTAKIWNIPQLQNLSLEQILFLILVYHHNNQVNQALKIDAHQKNLRNIFKSLPDDLNKTIKNKVIIEKTQKIETQDKKRRKIEK